MNFIVYCLSQCMLISRDWLIKVIIMKAGNKRNAFCLISVTFDEGLFGLFTKISPNGAILPAESRLDYTHNRYVGEVAVQHGDCLH